MATLSTMNYCGMPQCNICKFKLLDLRTSVHGNTNGKEFTVDVSGSCRTTRCIYLIGCTKCQMKYVGFTKVSLNRRFSEHRSHIRCGTESYVMLNSR